MAKPIRQAHHVARQTCHCYLCGHPIRKGERYLAVTFKASCRDDWTGLRFTKTCHLCRADTLCECGDCDFVVNDKPADPLPDWLTDMIMPPSTHAMETTDDR